MGKPESTGNPESTGKPESTGNPESTGVITPESGTPASLVPVAAGHPAIATHSVEKAAAARSFDIL
jgi:hypothetical protein